MRSLRMRYSRSSNSRWVSSTARSPRWTSWVSGFSARSPTTSEADPRGGRRGSRARRRPGADAPAELRALRLLGHGLGQVVVVARVEALDARLDAVARGEH